MRKYSCYSHQTRCPAVVGPGLRTSCPDQLHITGFSVVPEAGRSEHHTIAWIAFRETPITPIKIEYLWAMVLGPSFAHLLRAWWGCEHRLGTFHLNNACCVTVLFYCPTLISRVSAAIRYARPLQSSAANRQQAHLCC